jgi:HD-GYP domain-containing protein (c-di-GMP phosphodiesterase class II)
MNLLLFQELELELVFMNKFIVILLFLPCLIFPTDKGIDFLEAANRHYILGEYKKAFDNINNYYSLPSRDSLGDKAVIIGEKIFYFHLQDLYSQGEDRLLPAKDLFEQKSEFLSKRVLVLLEAIYSDSSQESGTGEKEIIFDFSSDEIDLEGVEITKEELTKLLRESLGAGSANKSIKIEDLFFYFPMGAGIIGLFALFIFYIRKRKITTDSKLFKKCLEVGKTIDEATGRKNNSNNIGELVYKISRKKGLGDEKSVLNYAACLIYDIGLLRVQNEILLKDKVSLEEYEEIKKHVEYGQEMIDFIPKKYKELFSDAIKNHHENIDGSGYPMGITQDKLEFLPRVIRIVESYVSLISSRSYKSINDRETAILELRGSSKYDQEIVDLLDGVI